MEKEDLKIKNILSQNIYWEDNGESYLGYGIETANVSIKYGVSFILLKLVYRKDTGILAVYVNFHELKGSIKMGGHAAYDLSNSKELDYWVLNCIFSEYITNEIINSIKHQIKY